MTLQTSQIVPATTAPPVVDIQGVTKIYEQGDVIFEALKGVDVQIGQGEMVALMGPSGSGKTTLMQIIGLLDRPNGGTYHLAGRDVTTLSENERAEARNEDIGFVFQAFHLLPRLNLVENVEVPLTYAGWPAHERRERAMQVLERVGLAGKAGNLPSQISGGQKQRVAVARALAGRPRLLLADEPTGNLDPDNSREVLKVLQNVNLRGTTVIVATHARELVETYRHRTLTLRKGKLVRDDPLGGYTL